MIGVSQFPQILNESFLKIQLATTIFAWLGFALNGILISALLSAWHKFDKRRAAMKFLICAQALPDFLLGALVAPVGICMHEYHRFPGKATLVAHGHEKTLFWQGKFCSFYGFSCHILCCTSLLNMCLITWERYQAISKPLCGHLPKKKLIKYYFCTWIGASCYASFTFVERGFVLTASRTGCDGLTGPGFEAALTMLIILCCGSFCVLCYIKMYRIVQRSSLFRSSITVHSKQEVKVEKQFFIIVACFVLCWGVTGFQWFMGMTGLGFHSRFFSWIEILGVQFCLLNSVFNPLLCFLLFADVRQAAFRLFLPQFLSKAKKIAHRSQSGRECVRAPHVRKIYASCLHSRTLE